MIADDEVTLIGQNDCQREGNMGLRGGGVDILVIPWLIYMYIMQKYTYKCRWGIMYAIVIARGQGFMAVNRPESEGGLRCHKSLATVL